MKQRTSHHISTWYEKWPACHRGDIRQRNVTARADNTQPKPIVHFALVDSTLRRTHSNEHSSVMSFIWMDSGIEQSSIFQEAKWHHLWPAGPSSCTEQKHKLCRDNYSLFKTVDPHYTLQHKETMTECSTNLHNLVTQHADCTKNKNLGISQTAKKAIPQMQVDLEKGDVICCLYFEKSFPPYSR